MEKLTKAQKNNLEIIKNNREFNFGSRNWDSLNNLKKKGFIKDVVCVGDADGLFSTGKPYFYKAIL